MVDGHSGGGAGHVPEDVAQACAASPETIAIESASERWSHATLAARAEALARALVDAGVRPGDLVAVCLPRSPAQIAALLAAWRAGAAYLPLDPAWPEARLARLLADAGCAALIADSGTGARIAGALPCLAPDVSGTAPLPPWAPASDRLAYVIYTSGSSGKPKGVEVSHANLAALSAWHREAFALTAGMRTSHLAGLGFDAAAWEVWPTLAAGGTLVLAGDAQRRDPVALRDWLVAERIELAFAPTALAEPLLRLDWPTDTALRALLTGADRLTARPPAGLPFPLVNNYGPTESTVVATSGIVAPEGEDLPSIGRAIAGTAAHILDTQGEPVSPGAIGELWIGGAQVARGYRGDPVRSAARFVVHPRFGRLYRSGDLVAERPDGEIAFHGRVDDQIQIRGHRVEPGEIVAALLHQPLIAAAAVIMRAGELVAYVVPAMETTPTADQLRAALSETIPDYMVPARFAHLPVLPLTENGKIDVAALPDPRDHALPEAARRGASTPTEARLLQIVSAVVGRGDIGVDDDFFLLGGHSLLGTQVVVRARDAFGVELTLFHLFEGRTVASLAATIERLAREMLADLSDEDIQRLAAAAG